MVKLPGAKNRLLSLLPRAERKLLAGRMERVQLPLKTIVCEVGEPLRELHFPLSCVISSMLILENGAPVEAGTIGNEGMAGVAVLLDRRPPSPFRLIQQVEGESLRLPETAAREALAEAPGLRKILTRYAFGFLHQTAQNAACNLHHTVEERMARWLLASADRAGREEFELTQEFLSQMLGVRRQSVNRIAGALQQSKIIQYRWGRLKILDRAGLERVACECYEATKQGYQRAMGVR